MKLGVISDTHDNLETVKKAVKFLERRTETVVHCGDMVSPFTAKFFDADFDFYYVKGNNDGEWMLKERVEEIGVFLGEQGEIESNGKKIGVYHGTEESIVKSMIESERYDYILRGHTHEEGVNEYGKTVELNPGGISIPGSESDFHVAIVDLQKDEVKFHRV